MTNLDLVKAGLFKTINAGSAEKEITTPFCCDLLSISMGKAPEGSAWTTIMGNVNTIAVSTLTEAACVVLCEGVKLDDTAIQKALDEDITVLATEEPIFSAALKIHEFINA